MFRALLSLMTRRLISWSVTGDIPRSRRRQTAWLPARWAAELFAVAAVGLMAQSARASEPDGRQPSPSAPQDDRSGGTEREWYGAPMVVADAFGFGLLTCGVLVHDHDGGFVAPLVSVGLGLYLLGGPIVHIAEKRTGVGFASFSLRLGMPLFGAAVGFIGVGVASRQPLSALGGGALGLLGGMLAGATIDDALLARKPVRAKRLALWVAPIYQPSDGEPSWLPSPSG